jgi:hypothetical protein
VTRRALFEGLIVDPLDRPVEVAYIGGDACYVVDDMGFLRHIDSEEVDRQVLDQLRQWIKGHEEIISLGTMEMLGQEDIFTKALIDRSLQNVEGQFSQLLEAGLPEEARAWLGMLGFRVVIDERGQLVRLEQPSGAAPGDPEE